MTTKNKMFDTSPRLYARVAGLLYLIIIIAGFSSEFFLEGKLLYQVMLSLQLPILLHLRDYGVLELRWTFFVLFAPL